MQDLGISSRRTSRGAIGSLANSASGGKFNKHTADKDLSELNQSIFDRFEKDIVPLLEDLQKTIGQRRDEFVTDAREDAVNAVNQTAAQADLRRSALGISSIGTDADKKRALSLGHTATEAFGVNKAIDDADMADANAADTIMRMATGMESQAIGNLSNAAGMASQREQTGIARKSQQQTQAMQGAATMAMMAMMFM